MVTFYLRNGTVCTIRASGTEPKVKYYVESCCDILSDAVKQADEVTHHVCNTLIQPNLYH